MDNVMDLHSPSNAVKLKYDLTHLIDLKWVALVKNGTGATSQACQSCERFKRMMDLECDERVTHLARATLLERFLANKNQTMSSPEDIKTLPAQFRNTVAFLQTRLLVLNKCRSG